MILLFHVRSTAALHGNPLSREKQLKEGGSDQGRSLEQSHAVGRVGRYSAPAVLAAPPTRAPAR